VSERVQASRPAEGAFVPAPRPRVEVETMAGRWVKTSDGPQWIESLDVDADGDAVRVRVYGGTTAPSPAEWGSARSEVVYASSMATGDARGGGFVTRYAIDGMDVELQANLNLGLLVVATYISFREPGPYADRFTREFFRREVSA
jgi:hypothetical protein